MNAVRAVFTQAKEFKYLKVVFKINRKMEHEMDRRFGAASLGMLVLYLTTMV